MKDRWSLPRRVHFILHCSGTFFDAMCITRSCVRCEIVVCIECASVQLTASAITHTLNFGLHQQSHIHSLASSHITCITMPNRRSSSSYLYVDCVQFTNENISDFQSRSHNAIRFMHNKFIVFSCVNGRRANERLEFIADDLYFCMCVDRMAFNLAQKCYSKQIACF